MYTGERIPKLTVRTLFLIKNGRRYHIDVVVIVGRRNAAYHTILVFIVESGALYCFTWVSFGRVYASR